MFYANMVLSADGRTEGATGYGEGNEGEGAISRTAALVQVADLSTHQSGSIARRATHVTDRWMCGAIFISDDDDDVTLAAS